MKVIRVRNVHAALPVALRHLYAHGVERPSRNGPVLQSPEPVATVYTHPCERVLFWPERDANPFYHLYEALWMLAGRNDVEPLTRYAKNAANYSDDGKTWHGAYGWRWRHHFDTFRNLRQNKRNLPSGIQEIQTIDQLPIIVEALKKDPTDRRCVLAMWDASVDLGRQGKDLPCNDTATFQIGPDGRLNLVVFCRSNDIVWGAYGANAVHFSFLLEYMAQRIGVPVGTYTQISVNWHGYLDTLEKVKSLAEIDVFDDYIAPNAYGPNPYVSGEVKALPMMANDAVIKGILTAADSGFTTEPEKFFTDWDAAVYRALYAHHVYKRDGRDEALRSLYNADVSVDWVRAAMEWLKRRKA